MITPLGEGGRGGIDRMMDGLRRRLALDPPAGLDIAFTTTRGQGHIALSVPLVLRTVSRLSRRPFGFGPDVAHINLSTQGSTLRKLVVAGVARLLGVPYVLHLHGSAYDAYWSRVPRPLGRMIAAMFANASRILVLGRFWREAVAGRVPEAASRIEILPNASEPAIHGPREGGDPTTATTILFLGEIGPRKGVPELIEALSRLPATPPWRAVLAGNGRVEESRAEIVRLGLADRIEMPGWVGPDRVAELRAAADIMVLPSHEENLPMSVIEGMADGMAVVATPVGAVEDIVTDGCTGLLVPPGDVEALSAALARLVADPELRRTLGDAARAYHRQHLEMGTFVARLIDVWRGVAVEARAAGR